jgi:ComF family protein
MIKVNSGIRRGLQSALDLLLVQRCIYCDQPSRAIEPLCEGCADALTPNDNPCPRCALPDCRGRLCPQCQQQPHLLTGVTAPFCYDAALSYFMHRWKYKGERRLAATAAKLMLKASICSVNCDIVIATPLHWRRHLQRGFNQSQDLLEALCHRSPALHRQQQTRLRRRRATCPQAGSSRRQRLENLQGAFSVCGDVRDQRIVIVDDVCTTGATGNAIARQLFDAGAAEVHLWCFARTPAS